MVIREAFDLRSQHDQPLFMPIEVSHETSTDIPGNDRVRVDGCEDIEQVLDVHVFQHDPSCLLEARLVRINKNQQAAKVLVLCFAEEWR